MNQTMIKQDPAVCEAIRKAGPAMEREKYGPLASDPVSRFIFRDKHGIGPAQLILDTVLPFHEVVVFTESQHRFISSPNGKEGVVDVRIHTESGRIYIVEFQLYHHPDSVCQERLTAYGAMQVTELLGKGDGWPSVRPVCVMMMTEEDVLQEGRSQYTVVPYVKETKKPAEAYAFLSGMPYYIYLNPGNDKDDSKAARLVRDFFSADVEDVSSPVLRDALEYVRGQSEEVWSMFMTEDFWDIVNQKDRKIDALARKAEASDQKAAVLSEENTVLSEENTVLKKLLRDHGIAFN